MKSCVGVNPCDLVSDPVFVMISPTLLIILIYIVQNKMSYLALDTEVKGLLLKSKNYRTVIVDHEDK